MNDINNIKSDFEKEWNSVGVYHGKGFFKDLIDWEEILNILNREITKKTPKVPLKINNDFEIIHKDILAVKKLSYLDKNYDKHKVESDATFFFSLFFFEETIGLVIPKSIRNKISELDYILDTKSNYSSLKISLSDKFVPYESHDWHTCIIQLAGTNEWKLRKSPFDSEKLYFMEQGDVLIFKEGFEHQITNEKPRSSMVGRFTLGKSYQEEVKTWN